MKRFGNFLAIVLVVLALGMAFGSHAIFAQEATAKKALVPAATDINQDELSASVPALGALHKVVYPLWHVAYPAKDCAMIKTLLPQMDTLVAELDKAPLPGILREKKEAWETGKASLKSILEKLHTAAKADNQEEMLSLTEAFHAGYERLVRTVRPVVSELEAFHQELYKLYHYYTPAYDLEKIRGAATAMTEKLGALKAAQLPKRLADRQEKFQADVLKLEAAVNDLNATVKTDAKEKVKAAVEKVHTAYQETEKLFD
ncbi:MAG: hypothetical protein WC674_10150 [Candidatus Krumholzibacteriia bacterium]